MHQPAGNWEIVREGYVSTVATADCRLGREEPDNFKLGMTGLKIHSMRGSHAWIQCALRGLVL